MSLIDVSYFVCSDCKTVLPVPERVLASDGFFFNCSFCSRPISLRNIYKNNDLEIIESFGCAYGGKETPSLDSIKSKRKTESKVDHWISDSVSKADYQLDSSQDLQENSVVEGSASKWEVQTLDGRTFKFDFFSEVRKAVLDGKIVPGDFIVPFDGAKHPIEDYPGTADLFGNQYSKTKIGLREIPEWKPVSKGSKLDLENIFYTILLIGLGVGGYFAFPYAKEFWQAKQGERLLSGLSHNGATAINREALLLKANRAVHRPEIIELTGLIDDLSALAAKGNDDFSVVGKLSEVWTEIGVLKHDDASLKNAEYLAQYAKKQNPRHEAYLTAQARYLWRIGKPALAISLLEKNEPLSAENAFIMGNLFLETGENTKAIIYLSEAYSKDQDNTDYLLSLVDLYERDSKFREAAGFLQKALDRAPDDVALQGRLVAVYKKSKDTQSLEDFYRGMVFQGKNPEQNFYGLLSFFKDEKRHEDVVREASVFLSRFSASALAPQVSAMQKDSREKIEEAAAAAKAAAAAQKPRTRSRRKP